MHQEGGGGVIYLDPLDVLYGVCGEVVVVYFHTFITIDVCCWVTPIGGWAIIKGSFRTVVQSNSRSFI